MVVGAGRPWSGGGCLARGGRRGQSLVRYRARRGGMGGTLIQGADEVPPAPAAAPAVPHTAAPDGPAGTPSRSGRVPDAITRAGGLVCAAVGLTVIAAWYVRATGILRFGSQNPMSFNTALALVVTGVALVALARTRPRA